MVAAGETGEPGEAGEPGVPGMSGVEEDEEFEELQPPQPALHTFGSVWDSQIGVPSGPTSTHVQGDFDEEDLDEPAGCFRASSARSSSSSSGGTSDHGSAERCSDFTRSSERGGRSIGRPCCGD